MTITAVEAIDHSTVPQEIDQAISSLLFTIVDTLAVNLGLTKKDYRMYFDTPDHQPANSVKLSGLRVGREFDLADKGKIDVTEILIRDSKAIEYFLSINSTEIIVRGMDGVETSYYA